MAKPPQNPSLVSEVLYHTSTVRLYAFSGDRSAVLIATPSIFLVRARARTPVGCTNTFRLAYTGRFRFCANTSYDSLYKAPGLWYKLSTGCANIIAYRVYCLYRLYAECTNVSPITELISEVYRLRNRASSLSSACTICLPSVKFIFQLYTICPRNVEFTLRLYNLSSKCTFNRPTVQMVLRSYNSSAKRGFPHPIVQSVGALSVQLVVSVRQMPYQVTVFSSVCQRLVSGLSIDELTLLNQFTSEKEGERGPRFRS